MLRVNSSSLLSAVLALVLTASVAGAQDPVVVPQGKPLDPANLDTTCAACTDFFGFANGGWLKRNPIPAAYASWGSFNELGELNNKALLGILQKLASNPGAASSPDLAKVGYLYASCMDSTRAERLGAAPIASALATVNSINSPDALKKYIAAQHASGSNVLFGFGSTQDSKNSSEVIAGARQGGISLPDRDYYLNTDARSVELRSAYAAHVARMLQLSGESATQAAADAQRVLALETALAKASLTRVQQRDPVLTYNRKSPAELAQLTPNFDWKAFFAAVGQPNIAAVDVQAPVFMQTVDSMIVATPLSDWRAYMRWNVVRGAAPTLSSAFVNEAFAFRQKLTGARTQLPRFKRCTQLVDGTMGEALGQAYVKENFTPEARARAQTMVRNLAQSFRARIATLEWMSDSTRQQAYAKLDAFVSKIGYPDRWRSYAALAVAPSQSLYANTEALKRFETAYDLSQIGKPVDRTRWGMSPPTVNAYYNPAMNEIVFPAGILQPPFFDPRADDAVNYGGMGAVIGHEMSHGFDDEGSQYDAKGNLRNWFTKGDLAAFRVKTDAYARQFDTYTILDSARVNGKLTNGENIADLVGLTVAYDALQKALAGKPRPLIDGFTPEQRFFLAWAQIWRSDTRPEAARVSLATNPHSPNLWRTNGPLSNMPQFAKAWGYKVGDRMVRTGDQRVVIW